MRKFKVATHLFQGMFFLRSSPKKDSLTDPELIAQYVQKGQTEAVAVLYERYSVQIYAICKKYLKDEDETRDAAMEVFEYMLKELPKYEIRAFKSWLARAVSNFCLMRIRKNKALNNQETVFRQSESEDMESGDSLHLPDELPPQEVELIRLESALTGLREEQRVCIELFFLKNKSYDEVVELTGFSYNQVKSHIQNGKRNLKIRMTEGDEPGTP